MPRSPKSMFRIIGIFRDGQYSNKRHTVVSRVYDSVDAQQVSQAADDFIAIAKKKGLTKKELIRVKPVTADIP